MVERGKLHGAAVPSQLGLVAIRPLGERMMRYFRWQYGRQKSGYKKMALFKFRLRGCWFDGWILYYPQGTFIPRHTDPIEGHMHFRCNVILKQCKCGGTFWAAKSLVDRKRIKIFASDAEHSVSMIEQGSRWVLSLGLAIPIGKKADLT